jgi:hypothetical protein
VVPGSNPGTDLFGFNRFHYFSHTVLTDGTYMPTPLPVTYDLMKIIVLGEIVSISNDRDIGNQEICRNDIAVVVHVWTGIDLSCRSRLLRVLEKAETVITVPK